MGRSSKVITTGAIALVGAKLFRQQEEFVPAPTRAAPAAAAATATAAGFAVQVGSVPEQVGQIGMAAQRVQGLREGGAALSRAEERGSRGRRGMALLLLAASAALLPSASVAAADVDVARMVREAADTAIAAKFATMSTFALDGGISSRIIYPKPPNASSGESPELKVVTLATLNTTRKFSEVLANPSVSLVYWDQKGMGEVTLRGRARVCGPAEAEEGFYPPWKKNYPQGSATPHYSLLRIDVTRLEFLSYVRFHVDEGGSRPDWRPLTLQRDPSGEWSYSPPPDSLREELF